MTNTIIPNKIVELTQVSKPAELTWKNYANQKFGDRKSVVSDLLILSGFKEPERKAACGGVDPLEFLTLYAQDNLAYDEGNKPYKVENRDEYLKLASIDKLNKFGQSYKEGTPIFCNTKLAEIMVDTAISFYNKHGLKIRVYDCLRTVDSAFLLYRDASEDDRQLLAKPGQSAHNMGMAIDITIIGKNGEDIERVDHTVLDVIDRNYKGGEITAAQRDFRLELEKEFQKASYKNGVVIAPLPRENWDFRFPENLESPMLHRMVESLARCTDQHEYYESSIKGKKIDFKDFKDIWSKLNEEGQLNKLFEVKKAIVPTKKNMEAICYSKYQPIYDRDIHRPFTVADAEIGSNLSKT